VIKMCKSMQHGVIPPVQSFERVNPIINPDLPINIAKTETRLTDDAVLSVSSIGLGGINAHCVMRFPPPDSRKRLEDAHDLLPARAVTTLPPPARRQVNAKSDVDIPKFVALCASHILGVEVEENMDLRFAGLDSNGQVRLMRKVADLSPSLSLRLVILLPLIRDSLPILIFLT
jgi:hypothetical protein